MYALLIPGIHGRGWERVGLILKKLPWKHGAPRRGAVIDAPPAGAQQRVNVALCARPPLPSARPPSSNPSYQVTLPPPFLV